MMNKKHRQGCAVSILMPLGPYADKDPPRRGVADLVVGDHWPLEIEDRAVKLTLDADGASITFCLAARFDEFDGHADAWTAFARMPGVIAVLPMPHVAWFCFDHSGMHCRAPFPLNCDEDPVGARRALLAPNADVQITLFGVAGRTVRSIHRGVCLDWIRTTLAEAARDAPRITMRQAQLEAARQMAGLSADAMFGAAMIGHVRPLLDGVDPRRAT